MQGATANEKSLAYGGRDELRRTLAKIRAGLMDAKTLKESKNMSEEEIADRIRYIVAITGKGPIGKFTGRWYNAVDERGQRWVEHQVSLWRPD